MEAREGTSASGVTVIGAEVPSNYKMAPRNENQSQVMVGAPMVGGMHPPPVSVGAGGTLGKKKRGRPRKYGPDGTVNMAFSPLPISSSAPPPSSSSIDFSMAGKRGRGRHAGFESKQHRGGADSGKLGNGILHN